MSVIRRYNYNFNFQYIYNSPGAPKRWCPKPDKATRRATEKSNREEHQRGASEERNGQWSATERRKEKNGREKKREEREERRTGREGREENGKMNGKMNGSVECRRVWPKGWATTGGTSNPEKWGPEGAGPRRGVAPKGGAPTGGWPKISCFFPSPTPIFLSFFPSVLGNMTQITERTGRPVDVKTNKKCQGKINALNDIDCIPSNVQSSRQEALCV